MTVAPSSPTLAEAYAECGRITREQARNFHYGIRLLPPDKRAALSAVYAFARRADDAGDDPGLSPQERLGRLALLRSDLENVGEHSADPVLVALRDAARRFPLPVEALGELLDGIEMDVRGTRYATFEDLVVYCRRVAGTVGRLSLSIFGGRGVSPEGYALADHLGVALQQTNILRDIREDLLSGRVYLPDQELKTFGVRLEVDADGAVGGPRDRLVDFMRMATARAESWYVDGLRLLDLLDRRSFACCAAMAGIYHRLNGVIAANPAAVLDGRLSLTGAQKAAVAARSLAGWRS
jgi:phytoene synthase